MFSKQAVHQTPTALRRSKKGTAATASDEGRAEETPLSVWQSLIRVDSTAITQARVRYTRILRESRALRSSAKLSECQQQELQRYILLERRVKRQLVRLQQRLEHDIEQRNTLQAELSLDTED